MTAPSPAGGIPVRIERSETSSSNPRTQTLCEHHHAADPYPRKRSVTQNWPEIVGERSEESSKRSSHDADTSGLRAQTVALMHEAVEYGQRGDQWHSFYHAQSPAVFHLVNECARATVTLDRAENFRQAELEEQTIAEKRTWIRKQKRRLRYLSSKLSYRPDEALEQLRGFGEGVAFLIRSFENFCTDVQSHGFLSPEQVDRVFELCGALPGPASIRENPLAYFVHLFNLGCTPACLAPGDRGLARARQSPRGAPRHSRSRSSGAPMPTASGATSWARSRSSWRSSGSSPRASTATWTSRAYRGP